MLNGPLRCLIYIAAWGILCFPMGRFIKRLSPRWDRRPFAPWSWEEEGRFYERLGIRVWKNFAPDVSWVFPGIVPKKEVVGRPTAAGMRDMLLETCVAEVTHAILCVAGLAILPLWPGSGGVVVFLVYIFIGNVPFIMIQRYNRPRFQLLLQAVEARERRLMDARSDPLQH